MNFSDLVHPIQHTHHALQRQVVRAINRALTSQNFLIGFYIVEYGQKGEDRAAYGKGLLEEVTANFKASGVKWLTPPELSRCRQFYHTYPQILRTVSLESENKSFVCKYLVQLPSSSCCNLSKTN